MKLYATVSSERASKGQDGNEYLCIELKVNDRNIPVGMICLDYKEDMKEYGADYDEWVLSWYAGTGKPYEYKNAEIIAQGHTKPNAKKQ